MVQRVWPGMGLMLIVVTVSVRAAGPLEQSLSDTEGRRKAAENGLRQIKAKSQADAEHVRTLYTAAASSNNTWLDAVCQAVEQGTPTAPDVSGVAGPAASSLVEWVAARNKALGVAAMTAPVTESVKKSTERDLTDIASGSWRDNRGQSAEKRKQAAATLRERLRWKAFEEIQ